MSELDKGGLAREFEPRGGLKILEIGRGERSGIVPKVGDLYVGIDVAYGDSIAVSGGESTPRQILVNDVSRLPANFVPDLVLLVAPNPNDIESGMLFDYERFITQAGVVVVVLDMRTREALSGSGVRGLVRKVVQDLQEMGRGLVHSRMVEGHNLTGLMGVLGIDRGSDVGGSRDLGEKSVVIWSSR